MKKTVINLTSLIFLIALSSCAWQKDKSKPSITMPQEAKKRIESMTDEEALISKDYFAKIDRPETAIKCGQRYLAKSSDQKTCAQVTLDLIDLCIAAQDFEKAEKYANDYKTLYPGSAHLQDACFKEILASLALINDCERDQSKTKQTIELANDFLKTFNNSEHINKVNEALKVCYETLFESERGIIESYLKRHALTQTDHPLKAAELRIASLKEALFQNVQSGSARVLDLEIKLAQIQKKDLVVQSKLQELSTKFPEFAAQKSVVAQRAKRPSLRF